MNKNTKIIIGSVLLITGGYFIFKYFSKRKPKNEPSTIDPILQSAQVPQPTPSITSSTFPLKRGSRGSKVKELQYAILKYDKNLLPKFGADGDFGAETESAVEKLLIKKTVDSQKDIEKIIQMYNKINFPYVTPNPNGNYPFPSPF